MCKAIQDSFNLEAVISVGNILGEGVLWRPSDQTIWWTDIQGKALYCLEWGKAHPKNQINRYSGI